MRLESRDAAAHQRCCPLIPWYVNGTLSEDDREPLHRHLEVCAECRADLAFERQIHGRITQQAAVEYMPAGSLKKLLGRIEGSAAGTQAQHGVQTQDGVRGDGAPAAAPLALRQRPRLLKGRRWPSMLAASVAVLAIAVSLLALGRFMPQHGASAGYITVTSNERRPADVAIRAVFAPDITLNELQGLLDEAQLRIISGPTEAGVYSLAMTSSQPVTTSLALLRRHSSVRFAESTRVKPGPDRSP
jgi:anti-sigma factor RsiW